MQLSSRSIRGLCPALLNKLSCPTTLPMGLAKLLFKVCLSASADFTTYKQANKYNIQWVNNCFIM